MSVGRHELTRGLKKRVNQLYQGPQVSEFLARRALEAILDLIQEGVNREKKVCLRGFGTFSLKTLRGKKVRHFPSGEMITLPERPKVVFRASPSLLKRLQE